MEVRFKKKSDAVNVVITLGLKEIWIRPTITYGLVACYVNEAGRENYTGPAKTGEWVIEEKY